MNQFETPVFANVQEHRLACRKGQYSGPTGGVIPENVLCNLVVLPQSEAYDFLVYCMRNPKPCPVIEVFDPGDPISKFAAPGADMRTDLSRYAVSRFGESQGTCTDITELWAQDSVALLMGSSLTFDHALQRAGVKASPEVWVLKTSIQTQKAGRFSGPLIVTMRWMTSTQAIIATQLTARFAWNHGSPIHIGDPADIGADLEQPIWGKPVDEIPKGIVPVFWACGVTPQFTAESAKPSLMITHAPSHGFITDLKADQYCLP
ncbi:MAG TPA: DUF1445 domain-containing protein [Phycisphaerales bacterium]|nr:DUF1445 domain-containing protein [Phycisphaerales bacterium]HCD34046.1 DUF1445 domain-containing protein [Phycisphaerales bacterium]|tara:strand:- start:108478 stop:109263 length:786 start_codon:yes stop_codon:yes gene_type:complete